MRVLVWALAALVFSAPEVAPGWASAYAPGWASAYAPGVFDEVVTVRFANGWWRSTPPGDWYTVAGYAAVRDCDLVGQVMEMRPAGAARWSRVLVADCAGDWATLEWMVVNDIVVELDHGLWTRWADAWGAPLRVEVRG